MESRPFLLGTNTGKESSTPNAHGFESALILPSLTTRPRSQAFGIGFDFIIKDLSVIIGQKWPKMKGIAAVKRQKPILYRTGLEMHSWVPATRHEYAPDRQPQGLISGGSLWASSQPAGWLSALSSKHNPVQGSHGLRYTLVFLGGSSLWEGCRSDSA